MFTTAVTRDGKVGTVIEQVKGVFTLELMNGEIIFTSDISKASEDQIRTAKTIAELDKQPLYLN